MAAVDLEVLPEDEQMLGALVPGECRRDLSLGSLTSRRTRRPVAPEMSLMTTSNCRFHWTSAFCIRLIVVAALWISVSR
jgi:hypothetical protein